MLEDNLARVLTGLRYHGNEYANLHDPMEIVNPSRHHDWGEKVMPTLGITVPEVTDNAQKTADAAKASSDQTTTEATSLLAQVQQYIKDNKIDLAEKTIDKLDGMKGSLPASLQTQIETAQAALKAKKAVGMLSK